MEAWLRSRSDRGRATRWAGVAVLSLFLAGAAPGGSRARFGLGLETFFEHQESLRITGMESTFTLRDLVRGEEESGILHGDPRLLNRKFDVVWEMEGAGIELPVILSHFGGSARSTLVLKAATADVTLDFLDRTQPQDSSSLGGRGNLFGAELSFASEPSPNRPWFTEASLGFQKIPPFSVERSPRFGPAGFEVPEDEVRLGRDVQELAARIGYSFSGGRVSAYTGVLHRWTDLEIEDDLRYRDPLGTTETRLSSLTDLESEVSLAVAGVDYRLGPRLRGRLETSVGEEDWGVALKVVYWKRQAVRLSPGEGVEAEQRTKEIAIAIASRLAQVEADFLAGWKNLKVVEGLGGRRAYLVGDVSDLLEQTEKKLLDILDDYRELEPLGDWVEDEFRRVREELALDPQLAAPLSQPSQMQVSLARMRPLSVSLYGAVSDRWAQVERGISDQRQTDPLLDRIREVIAFTRKLRLRMVIMFTPKKPLGEETILTIYPRNDPNSPACRFDLGPEDPQPICLGSYSFQLTNGNGKVLPYCFVNDRGSASPCPLELLENCVILECGLAGCKKRNCP